MLPSAPGLKNKSAKKKKKAYLVIFLAAPEMHWDVISRQVGESRR